MKTRNGRFPFYSISVSASVASVPPENKTQRRRKAAFFAQPIKVLVPGSGQNCCKTKMAADNTVGKVISCLIIYLLRRRRRRRLLAKQRKNKSFWVKNISLKRENQGAFFNLVKELRLSDCEYYVRWWFKHDHFDDPLNWMFHKEEHYK